MKFYKFKRKNYRNSGKMVGQTFNPSGGTASRPQLATLWLDVDDPTGIWKSIGETIPLKEAIKRFPRAKAFKDLSVACHDINHHVTPRECK